MKKAYEILQAYALAFIILLAAFRQILNLAASYSITLAGTFLVVFTAASLVVFVMTFSYFKSSWSLPHRGYMFSMLWASVSGLMIGLSGLHYALTGNTELHILMIKVNPIPFVLLCFGVLIEIIERPKK